MNDFKLLPDDPRLTAYALGELEGDERAEVEAALRRDPAARAAVEEIRVTAAQLQAALAEESSLPAAAGEGAAGEATTRRRRRARRKVTRVPLVYYAIGGLAAACFAVLIALNPAPDMRKTQPDSAQATAVPKQNADVRAESAAVAELEQVADGEGLVSGEERVEDPPYRIGEAREVLAEQVQPPEVRVELADETRPAEPQTVPALELPKPVPLALAIEPARAREQFPDDDVIMLSPFEVAVDNDRDAARPLADATSNRVRREALPRAPRGARFVEGAEADVESRENAFVAVTETPLSSVPAEIEMESYASLRQFLAAGRLPPRQAVRIEELLNYFPYRYTPPTGDDVPFAAQVTVTEAPWAPQHRLVRIALKGREAREEYATTSPHMRAAANLVFLIDVSASMFTHTKLPAAQDSIRRLLTRLRPDDRVAIVTYSGAEGLALPSVPAARAGEIEAAVDALRSDSDTGGAKGLRLAYNVARANFVPNGINRVILCTDDDFHLGMPSEQEMLQFVANRAQFGIGLSVLAFGVADARPDMVRTLAAHGHGRFAYVQSRAHAEKLLAIEVESALAAIAEDVKIEVEFNPAKVARYRLIGYENPPLRREEFDDAPEGGQIRSGHTVTALYEIVPAGLLDKPKETWGDLEDLRYGHLLTVPKRPATGSALSNELLTVKVRYQRPGGLVARKLEFPVTDGGGRFAEASGDFKFAAAVAGFGMILRKSPHRGAATIGDVIAWAEAGAANPADDPGGYRRDFVGVVRQAQALLQ